MLARNLHNIACARIHKALVSSQQGLVPVTGILQVVSAVHPSHQHAEREKKTCTSLYLLYKSYDFGLIHAATFFNQLDC